MSSHRLPWYRQRWPWLLMLPPLAAVLAGGYTLYLAVKSWDGLVSDDYYKEGLAINKTLTRAARAAELGLYARIQLQDERLRLRFDAERLRTTLPPLIRVRLIHPTQQGMDVALNLVRDRDEYWAPVSLPVAGKWRIEIEDELHQWRLSGAAVLPTESEIVIEPFVPAAD